MNLPKGLSYIVLAGVAGLLATYGINRYITVKTDIPAVATASVAVATADIAPGTALNGQIVKVTSWPKELIPPKTASSVQQVDGRVVLAPVVKGEPILFTRLAPEGTSAGLSGLLDDNTRAVTVRVDDVSGVAGFVHPGDRVDVLADLKVPKTDENFSKTILQGIAVLTTGQIWEEKGESKPVVVNTVTLALTPEQAEILNLASNVGKIRLALRSRQNLASVPTKGVATSSIVGLGFAAAPSKGPAVEKDGRSVEVIKGVERTKATL